MDKIENTRRTATITLDTPIVRGETRIEEVTIRSPSAGELRGIKLTDLTQFEVGTLIKIVPRISSPTIHEHEAASLGIEDLIAIGDELANFLPQRGKVTDSPNA